ncbi:hypothetical protein Vadar_011295 [Vaccinium darrowii]|uniref:Uncharacterized protein n=1 Tax=Vaccinium darrowii TaxID=229202 RepID=A0ACB7Z384_9ERIC|nr:hypothetical protein Vadar_011295 [Vaccinium darrowii]
MARSIPYHNTRRLAVPKVILTTGYTAPTTPDTKENPYTTNVTLTKGICLVMVEAFHFFIKGLTGSITGLTLLALWDPIPTPGYGVLGDLLQERKIGKVDRERKVPTSHKQHDETKILGTVPSSLHQSIKYIAKNHLVTVHAEEDLTLLRPPAIPFIDVENNIPPDAHHAFELVPATFVPKHAFPSKPKLSSSNLMVAKIMLENGFEPGKGIDYFVDIEVEYQWMPSRCAGCKTFWHLALECPDNPVVPQSVPLEAANSETGNRVYPAIHYIENLSTPAISRERLRSMRRKLKRSYRGSHSDIRTLLTQKQRKSTPVSNGHEPGRDSTYYLLGRSLLGRRLSRCSVVMFWNNLHSLKSSRFRNCIYPKLPGSFVLQRISSSEMPTSKRSSVYYHLVARFLSMTERTLRNRTSPFLSFPEMQRIELIGTFL